jgi:hypothetical protein
MCTSDARSYWDAQSKFSDTNVVSEAIDAPELVCDVMSFIFTKTTATGIVEDVTVSRLAVAKILLGAGTTPLDSGDRDALDPKIGTFWTAAKAFFPSHVVLKEVQWHQYSAASNKPGPAQRIGVFGVAGTGSATNVVPDQVATSVTFRTASRIHWGRMYMPQPISTACTTYGKLSTTHCDGVALAFKNFLADIDTVDVGGTGITPVIRSSKAALLSIDEIHVDDVPDVIRSRRASFPTYRKSYTS